MQHAGKVRFDWVIGGTLVLGAVLAAGPALAQTDPFGRPAARDPFTTPGQPARPPAPAPQPASDDPGPLITPALVESLVPPLRSGGRAELLRRTQKVIPMVVIVRDMGSYVRALEAWTPTMRFPVLIDDGTRAAREDIARFVRAFKPERVVRWSTPDAPTLDTAGAVQSACESALRRVWGFGTDEVATLDAAAVAVCGVASPGVVVANASDPAWAGGLALAIGRAQTIVWVEARQELDGQLTKAEGDALCLAVEEALTGMGVSWRAVGDHIDVVSLCLNTPGRMGTDVAEERLAFTDRLGHFSDARADTARWGWASQVHGNHAQSVYRAMCGMFMEIDRAWLFDSYPGGQPWDTYALRFADQAFRQSGTIETSLIERSERSGWITNGLSAWRQAASVPINAQLVMVNTKGMRESFEFTDGGVGRCGDVPMLGLPAAVYFVHSWSSYYPGDRNTLAGRWFERGAFAYVGSVQEPFLQSFVPAAALAGRLLAGAAWGVAARADMSPAWRIAVFGDPLFSAARAQERASEALPLEGAVAVEDTMRQAVRESRMLDAVGDLVLMGRDDQVTRLVGAMLDREASAVTPALAHAALPSVFRTAAGDAERLGVFYALYRVLPEAEASDPGNRDMLWMTARRAIPTDGTIMGTLRPHVRPEHVTSDMVELAIYAATVRQRDAAVTMLTEYRRTLTDRGEQALVDTALSALRGF